MRSDFNFTVTSWFLENVRLKPYFNTQCPLPLTPQIKAFKASTTLDFLLFYLDTISYLHHMINLAWIDDFFQKKWHLFHTKWQLEKEFFILSEKWRLFYSK